MIVEFDYNEACTLISALNDAIEHIKDIPFEADLLERYKTLLEDIKKIGGF